MPTVENNQLDFEHALKEIIAEELRNSNPVPDLLGFLHVRSLLGTDFSRQLYQLMSEYVQDSAKIAPLLKVDAPKANFTIRPMARPRIKDWLIFEAIIDSLAGEILPDAGVCKRSFSILNFADRSAKPTNTWLTFDAFCRELYTCGYNYVVLTDITGYYENVRIAELQNRIIDCLPHCVVSTEFIGVLFKMLQKWSDERISGYGLPQGPRGSAFLADLFLDPVDRKMERYDGYYRYMDDIRILCKSELEARRALKDLIIALRELKLNINAKKTKILKDEEVNKFLFDPHRSLLNIIDQTMRSKSRPQIKNIIPPLVRLFKDTFLRDPFEKTHLNFALYRLCVLQASGFDLNTNEIIQIIKKNFVSKPHHAGLFLSFLAMFHDDIEIVEFLISFLKSAENIYDLQELRILQTLLRFNVTIDQSEIDFFVESAADSNKHYAVRGFYFLLVGKFGKNRDRDTIMSFYDKLTRVYTKMALVLAVQELGLASRNRFYSRVLRNETSKDMHQFVQYVKSLSKPLYYLVAERPKIETYAEHEKSLLDYV